MKSRIIFICVVLFSIWCLILSRAVFLQVLPNERLGQLQKKKFNKVVTLNARRGGIYDRNNKELAETIPSYSLYADPKIIKKDRYVARKLSKFFKRSERYYRKKIKNKKRRFTWLKRHLSKRDRDEIKAWKIRGLAFIEEPKRIYPNENLLSQVIGFVGSEDKGLEGLELKYDSFLKGESKKLRLQRDARGRPLLLNGQVFVDQPDGSNLHLTIDSELQFKLEKELVGAVKRFEADSAVGVVLDAKTSEVLAMANVPTFNLNSKRNLSGKNIKNKAVTDAFEPGSTMKTFLVAGALANSDIKPATKFNCENGKFKIGKYYIKEADQSHAAQTLTVGDILMRSSNVGSAKIGLKIGDQKVDSIYKNFGFGEKTGIDLPGESAGVMQATPWRKHLLANVSIGHGMTATPLQIANGYAAIANGGTLNKPYIVKSVVDLETGQKKRFTGQKIRRVLTESQARTMRLMLTNVTSEKGTGFNARIYGFPVAGKTGTAQKVDFKKGGYKAGAYVSSFAGFVPANDPKFVIYIAVDNPRLKFYGSTVVAPIFSKVASYAVLKAGLPPVLVKAKNIIADGSVSTLEDEKLKGAQAKALAKIKATPAGRVPFLEGLSLREAYSRIAGSGAKLNVLGSGRIVRTWPEAGKALPKNKKIKVRLQ